MQRFDALFNEIKNFQDDYERLNRSNAYGFNLFTILLKSGDEVNLHTKFIYELLNPMGSHGQGRVFLDIFLETLGLDISESRVDAFREKENIDILLQSGSTSIIIENKIYTKDHSSQLSRYLERIKSHGYKDGQIHLLYLTLFGEKPLEQKVQDKVYCISYKKEIISWLNISIKKVKHIPILRESLVQYLNLVKELTYQSKEKGLVMEIKELLLKDNNLERILSIESSVIEAKIEVQFNFWQELLSNLFPYYSFSFYNTNNNKGLKSSIRRYYQQQKNTKDYGVKYQIDENLSFFIELRKNLYYGFEFLEESSITKEQRDILDGLDIEWNEVSDTIYWRYPTKRLNFKDFNHQNIFDMIDKKKREIEIKKISNEIIGLISQYEKEILCLER